MPRLRINPPPTSACSSDLHHWLLGVMDAINQQTFYIRTTDGPNSSGLTGSVGEIVVDIGSSATTYWACTSDGTNAWRALTLA